MDKEKLLELIADDNLGLLKIKPKTSSVTTAEERLLNSFLEINDFYEETGLEPKANSDDMREFKLYSRLNSIRADNDKVETLMEHDRFGLLGVTKPINSVEDILRDDELGILDDETENIFDIKNIPKEINMPDYVAKRKPCKDFDQFEALFKECHSDITSGKRKLWPFKKEQQIEQGMFFVLKGVLLYVDKVGERENFKGKINARLRCIFENGTESDMLLRSLARELYKDGRRVLEHEDRLLKGFKNVTDKDNQTGFIYIIKSNSENPEIRDHNNLFKIGFSRVPVEERIKNASQDPTFLMAPVSIVSAYQCYNFNPQKLEHLLHTFFGSACLEISITDNDGFKHSPREWFIAPLEVIEQAIHYLLSEEITQFRYDPDKQEIVGK